MSLFHVAHGRMREKTVLQRLIMAARLPGEAADRTELGAHYENLIFQLSKQQVGAHVTGLLLIYPSCLLQVVESTREILMSVLRDVTELQQQKDSVLLDVKVVFVAHNPPERLFQQWSFKVLDAGQVVGDAAVKRPEEDEDSTETLVCGVLSALQKLSAELEISQKPLPGSVLDQSPELAVPQQILEKLLDRDQLQSPRQHLDMYASPPHISL
ncbi:testis-expressed protein 47 [Salarias fasciatus]|uniref:testis-expressed protein 47 n=1 Tax=Salarias fasciatus TaxID=181472 RepID=UPI0011767DAB|nr:testis-expressed protein 47 [Salarias fasciatus]